MRDYGKISPTFWIGKTGKELRGDPSAQIVALYLMTSPHAEMTGVFNCPVIYIAHETGLSLEGATKGLERLCGSGFCTFEADTDTIFVHEMARYQIGEDLKGNDNRVLGVQKIYKGMPDSPIKTAFFNRYKDDYFLTKKESPLVAPSKPETETETETGEETENKSAPASPKKFDIAAAIAAEGVGAQTITDWLQHRKSKKASLSKTVFDDRIRQAKIAGLILEDALKTEISRNWQGFEAAWLTGQQARASPATNRQKELERRNREVAERLCGEPE